MEMLSGPILSTDAGCLTVCIHVFRTAPQPPRSAATSRLRHLMRASFFDCQPPAPRTRDRHDQPRLRQPARAEGSPDRATGGPRGRVQRTFGSIGADAWKNLRPHTPNRHFEGGAAPHHPSPGTPCADREICSPRLVARHAPLHRPCPAPTPPRVLCGLPHPPSRNPTADYSALLPLARNAGPSWPGLGTTPLVHDRVMPQKKFSWHPAAPNPSAHPTTSHKRGAHRRAGDGRHRRRAISLRPARRRRTTPSPPWR